MGIYEDDRDEMEQFEREMKFVFFLITVISTVFFVLSIILLSFFFSSCGSTKHREICPAYKSYDRK